MAQWSAFHNNLIRWTTIILPWTGEHLKRRPVISMPQIIPPRTAKTLYNLTERLTYRSAWSYSKRRFTCVRSSRSRATPSRTTLPIRNSTRDKKISCLTHCNSSTMCRRKIAVTMSSCPQNRKESTKGSNANWMRNRKVDLSSKPWLKKAKNLCLICNKSPTMPWEPRTTKKLSS